MKILTSILKSTLNSGHRSKPIVDYRWLLSKCGRVTHLAVHNAFIISQVLMRMYIAMCQSLHKVKMYYTCCFLSSCSAAYLIKEGNEIGPTLLFLVE